MIMSDFVCSRVGECELLKLVHDLKLTASDYADYRASLVSKLRENDFFNRLFLFRVRVLDDGILGELFYRGVKLCDTLERQGVEVRVGTYRLSMSHSPRFKRELPRITVPNRTGILMHAGNYSKDSNGCILVGFNVDADKPIVLHSTATLNLLITNIIDNKISFINIKNYCDE